MFTDGAEKNKSTRHSSKETHKAHWAPENEAVVGQSP